MQNIVAVIQDAIIDNNTSMMNYLFSELSVLFNAYSVGFDKYGIFVVFKFEKDSFLHFFKMRYIAAKQPFLMAEYLATQDLYSLVTGKNPSSIKKFH